MYRIHVDAWPQLILLDRRLHYGHQNLIVLFRMMDIEQYTALVLIKTNHKKTQFKSRNIFRPVTHLILVSLLYKSLFETN